jgi:ribonuclease P protein component
MKEPAIKENHLYLKTFRTGKRFSGRILSLYVLKDHGASRLKKADPLHRKRNRLGLSVTKKIGGAVVRNRVKRILRAGYAGVKDELKTGFLVVISPYPKASAYKSTDVERELRYGFRKLDMLKDSPETVNREEKSTQ